MDLEYKDDWIVAPESSGLLVDPLSPDGIRAKHIYDNGLCHKCGKRQGIHKWAGSDLAFTHGWMVPRCDFCCYRAQLDHALRRAKAIPRLLYKTLIAWVTDK